MRKETRSAREHDGYIECIVSFIDIMGFRSLLSEEAPDKIAEKLFIFRGTRDRIDYSPDLSKNRRRVEIISDAIVAVRDVHAYGGGADNLFDELIYLRELQRSCILKGIVLRGAVTIGMIHVGSDWKGPLFGPALVEAYEMESQEIVYPRIGVHEMVIERAIFDSVESNDMPVELAREFTRLLLTQDGSGIHFIDYLRAEKDDFNHSPEEIHDFLVAHRNIIAKGLENKNSKILRKYGWLRNYHNRFIEGGIADGLTCH